MARFRGYRRRLLLLLISVALVTIVAGGTAAAGDPVVTEDGTLDPDCSATYANTSSIQEAVDNASAGDTVLVCPGEYDQSVTVTKSVRIVADNPEATADADRSILADTSGNATAFTVAADGVSIEGFTIRNYADAGVAVAPTGLRSDVTVNRTVVEGSGAGVLLVADGATASVSGVALEDLLLTANTAGLVVTAANGGTVESVTATQLVVNESSASAVELSATGASTITDSRLARSDLGGSAGNAGAGVWLADGAATNYGNVTVTENRIRNNGFGVRVASSVTSDITRADVNLSFNLIRDNGFGVGNANTATVFDARLNYWGDSTGPSSPTATPLEDPVLPAVADGTGDSVSEGDTSGVANVRFAPALGGKRTCTGDQLFDPLANVDRTYEATIEGETFSGPATDFVGACVWNRSALPLRTTADSAPQSILNIPTFLDTPDGQLPINRQELNVHEIGQVVNVTYETAEGAETSRYANQEAQVLIAQVTGSGVDSDATLEDLFSAEFNALSGSGTVGTNSVEFVAVENITLDENGTYGQGVQFTPTESGGYVAVLTATRYGPGYALDGTGNLTGNVHENELTAIGVEVIAVRETASSATPGTGSVAPGTATIYTGSTVQFDLDAGFDDSSFNHSLLLYNEDNLTNSKLVIDANGSFDTANLTFTNGTLTGTVTGPDGTTTNNVTITVDGPLSGVLANTSVVGNVTVIDSDSARLTDTTRSATVTLNTSGFGSGGTYRYVHVATASDGRFSTTDGTVTVACQTIPQAVDDNNDGVIGTFEITTAIDDYWNTAEPVPNSCGKVIPTVGTNSITTLIDDYWEPAAEVSY